MDNKAINEAITSFLNVELHAENRKKFWRNNAIPVIIEKLKSLEQGTSISVLAPLIEKVNYSGLRYSLVRPTDKFEPRLSGLDIKNTITFSETHDGSVEVMFHIISPTDERTYRYGSFEPNTPDKLDYDDLITKIIIEFIEAMHPVLEESISYEKRR